MSISRTPLALLLLAVSLPAGGTVRYLAFGDSITRGAFDDGGGFRNGYPPRLELLLADAEIEAEVAAFGVGGEWTSVGLSRIDDVLDTGGDALLLMEGTNDISVGLSPETTVFNLDEMASRAEERSLVAVHATVIPRVPWAQVDPANVINGSLVQLIRELAADTGRGLADPFAGFSALPNVFATHYHQGDDDPVGHPNGVGYDLLAEIFLPAAEAAARAGDVAIRVVTDPLVAGGLATFELDAGSLVEDAWWQFGEDGAAYADSGDGFRADFVFPSPGTYAVGVVATTTTGELATDSIEVEVGGGAPSSWAESRSIIQTVLASSRGGGGENEVIRSDVWILNHEPVAGLVDLVFYRRGGENDVPARRILGLPPAGGVFVPDVVGSLFEAEGSSGSLGIDVRMPDHPTAEVSVYSRAYVPEEIGSLGQIVPEEKATGWLAADRQVGGILEGDGWVSTLMAVNLGEAEGAVDVRLFDAEGSEVGVPQTFALGAHGVRFRRSDAMFPDVVGRPGPFVARFSSNGILFTASATLLEQVSRDQIFLAAEPAGASPELYVPEVINGSAAFGVQLSTRLSLSNTTGASSALAIELWERGANNADPRVEVLDLFPNTTVDIANVLPDLFGSDSTAGALRVTWANDDGVAPLLASYGLSETDRRFGTRVPILTALDGVGSRGQVFGAEMSETFLTRLGAMNLNLGNTVVELTLRRRTGEVIGVAEKSLKVQQHLERALYTFFGNEIAGEDWILDVEVLSGGPVLFYLAKTNVSGDVAFIPGRAVP